MRFILQKGRRKEKARRRKRKEKKERGKKIVDVGLSIYPRFAPAHD